MASVFISYAREDRPAAENLARSIAANGLDVWWDRELVPGNAYADIIEDELDKALAVIVLWSQHSRNSHWVRDEAAVGRDRNRLVPVQLDDRQPPLGFRQVHTADLRLWNGRDETPLGSILTSLNSLCGRTAGGDAQNAEKLSSSPTIVAGINATPNQKSLKTILKGEKRQRSFIRTFWLTSFLVSGVLGLALGILFGSTPGNAQYGNVVVGFGSFVVLGVGLVIGRFLIVIGRRLSKRKSVRYFDIPTITCLVLSFMMGIAIASGSPQESLADAIANAPVFAGFMFPLFALLSIPLGVIRGLGRTSFEDGR